MTRERRPEYVHGPVSTPGGQRPGFVGVQDSGQLPAGRYLFVQAGDVWAGIHLDGAALARLVALLCAPPASEGGQQVSVWAEPVQFGWRCDGCGITTFAQWSSPGRARADGDRHVCEVCQP